MFGSHAPNTTTGVVPAYAGATGLKTASSCPTKIRNQYTKEASSAMNTRIAMPLTEVASRKPASTIEAADNANLR